MAVSVPANTPVGQSNSDVEVRVPETSPPTSALVRGIARLFAMLRDAWLMIGITMLLYLALEIGARVVGIGRRPVASATDPEYEAAAALHPYRDSAWFKAIRLPGAASLGHYDPFRGWWPTAFQAPGVSVDSNGFRRTVQTAARRPTRHVYLFGGSAAWGFRIRDEHTVASALAAGLRRRGFDDVDVVNYGQLAFQNTQEVISLLLALRGDEAPSAAVFMNGHNDVSAALDFDEPGHMMNEAQARARFERRDTAGLGAEVRALAQHSAVIRALTARTVSEEAAMDSLSRPPRCDVLASQYRNLYRVARALGREFDFDVLYAWQPTVAASAKRLSPYEAALPASGWRARHRKALRDCGRTVATTMAALPDAHFVSLAGLFDHDTATTFLDNFGHLTESAAETVGDTLAAMVAPMLRARTAR